MMHPLFIFGIARGGTNLIARTLDEHSKVTVTLDILMPVFKLWRNLACLDRLPEEAKRRFDPASPFQDYNFHPDGAALLDAVFAADGALAVPPVARDELRQSVAARAALEHPEFAGSLAQLDGATIRDIFTSIIGIVSAGGGATAELAFTGFKEVWTIDFLPALARLFPAARFIVIHRDPRAVVASLLEMARKDETQRAHSVSYMRHWRKQVVLADAFTRDPVIASRFASVRFEDLCDHPADELARLCECLGIAFEPGMVRPDAGWEGNSSFGPRQADIDARAAERWRAAVAPDLRDTVDFFCGREMRMIGYKPVYEGGLNAGIVEMVRTFDADPGKWRSDAYDWQTGIAWECLRQQIAITGQPDDIAGRCFLIPPCRMVS